MVKPSKKDALDDVRQSSSVDSLSNENENKAKTKEKKTSNKKHSPLGRTLLPQNIKKGPLIAIVAIVAIIVIGASITIPISNSVITKENTVTSSSLQDAIAISDLSTAEFVYNGIASKYGENKEEPEYSISYDATCKAGISMKDVTFEIDDALKVVYPHFPEPAITNVSVDIDSISYLPRDPDIDVKEVLEFCEENVREGASKSEEFKRLATDNLRSVIEALTMPILEKSGFAIEWSD